MLSLLGMARYHLSRLYSIFHFCNIFVLLDPPRFRRLGHYWSVRGQDSSISYIDRYTCIYIYTYIYIYIYIYISLVYTYVYILILNDFFSMEYAGDFRKCGLPNDPLTD